MKRPRARGTLGPDRGEAFLTIRSGRNTPAGGGAIRYAGEGSFLAGLQLCIEQAQPVTKGVCIDHAVKVFEQE